MQYITNKTFSVFVHEQMALFLIFPLKFFSKFLLVLDLLYELYAKFSLSWIVKKKALEEMDLPPRLFNYVILIKIFLVSDWHHGQNQIFFLVQNFSFSHF